MKFGIALLPLVSASVLNYESFNRNASSASNSSSISGSNSSSNASTTVSLNRPAIHYTPEKGWMNDPNGLWFDAKDSLWHMYYQYNPNDTVWDLPIYWGHAVSKDLTFWNDSGIAFGPDSDEAGAFSGSVVIDYNNTSGFFNKSVDPRQRVVAIWTLNTTEEESQYLGYSVDGGYTFTQYDENPVLSINSKQFRDPKVFWHEGKNSSNWVMAVANAQEYEVLFYTSKDLKEWKNVSSFSHEGFLGYQYESPGLVKVPYIRNTSFAGTPESNITSSVPNLLNATYFNTTWWNGTLSNSTLSNSTLTNSTKTNSTMSKSSLSKLPSSNSSSLDSEDKDYVWVLFVSVNPGAPLGGSATQYFIGDFNGTHFTQFDDQTRFVDLGKDFYALQTFFNTPNGKDVLGVAWASNWQYANNVPTAPWRSSMSVPRNFTVTDFNSNPNSTELVLNSQPVLDFSYLRKNGTSYTIQDKELNSDENLSLNISSPSGVLEFELEWEVDQSNVSKKDFADLSLYFKGGKDKKEYLRLGYEANAAAFFIDRGHSNIDFVKENPFFTQRLSVNNGPSDYSSNTYNVYGIIDRNIIELFFNNGTISSTNTFFFTTGNYISSITAETSVDDVYKVSHLKVNQFFVN